MLHPWYQKIANLKQHCKPASYSNVLTVHISRILFIMHYAKAGKWGRIEVQKRNERLKKENENEISIELKNWFEQGPKNGSSRFENKGNTKDSEFGTFNCFSRTLDVWRIRTMKY